MRPDEILLSSPRPSAGPRARFMLPGVDRHGVTSARTTSSVSVSGSTLIEQEASAAGM